MTSRPISEAYIGRFAPSPSGPLHFGSLVTALASYLQAKTQNGSWILRIDDIDPPRQQVDADALIKASLHAHGMHWDKLVYQSERAEHYQNALKQLRESGRTYPCQCTRKRISEIGGHYDRHCLRHPPEAHQSCSIRFINEPVSPSLSEGFDDFILRRKDGLFAYHLCSVVDDIHDGITEIVRGEDLREATSAQSTLFDALGHRLPASVHIPLVLMPDGRKMSKQNQAPALDDGRASDNLLAALVFLQQSPPDALQGVSTEQIIQWAIDNWQLQPVYATP